MILRTELGERDKGLVVCRMWQNNLGRLLQSMYINRVKLFEEGKKEESSPRAHLRAGALAADHWHDSAQHSLSRGKSQELL